MDSVSQFALGAAVGVAVMGRRTAAWKAALWGGVCGTLPDLDAFVDHGDAVRDMTYHRAETHALFWLTLASLPVGALIAWLQRERALWRRWWLVAWLALVTHPLLDAMTVYGTQLALPFTDHPYGVGSLFIIDPLYTLPLIVGLAAAVAMREGRGWRWNLAGLLLSTAYVGWSVVAQQRAQALAAEALDAQGIAAERVLVTPMPLNTLLWRVVAVEADRYHEGFISLFDADPKRVPFDAYPRGAALYASLQRLWPVQRIAWFSHGFFRLDEVEGRVRITDLRMGMEPDYTFTFVVAERQSEWQPVTPRREAFVRPAVGATLGWMARRTLGSIEPPPR